MKKLEDYVTSIPNFPEEGIVFRDVTTILEDPDGLCLAVDGVRKMLEGVEYDSVIGPESRGFIFGVPVAYAERKGFIPVRKKGKLPREVLSMDYELEYGTATIELHKESIEPGQKIVIIDDLIRWRNHRSDYKAGGTVGRRSSKDLLYHGTCWITGKRKAERL